MGEAQFDPHPQKRLTPILHEGRVVGHGQQLAAERLSDRLQHVAKVHGTNRATAQPAAIVDRKMRRRTKKAEVSRLQREADEAAVAAARVGRRPIDQGPGLKLSYAAVLKKARKQPFRSVCSLSRMPNGSPIPAGCEATFHATKGLRVVRSETA